MSLPADAPSRFHLTRRNFAFTLMASMLGGATWMRFVEPWWLKTSEHTVPLGLGGGSLRLLHLSDLHADPMPLDHLQKSVRAGLALKPDLICVTGDFITTTYDQWDGYTALLGELSQAAPTFACLGNHDGGRWAQYSGYRNAQLVREMLTRARIRLLHNERVLFEHPRGRLTLAGVGDWWSAEVNEWQTFQDHTRTAGTPTVLLSHNPDTKDNLARAPWDLMLSGHTHGGQLSLPWIGEPFAPVRDKRYVRDLHPIGDRWLHITSGIGSLHKARFNCRPEISLLTLV